MAIRCFVLIFKITVAVSFVWDLCWPGLILSFDFSFNFMYFCPWNFGVDDQAMNQRFDWWCSINAPYLWMPPCPFFTTTLGRDMQPLLLGPLRSRHLQSRIRQLNGGQVSQWLVIIMALFRFIIRSSLLMNGTCWRPQAWQQYCLHVLLGASQRHQADQYGNWMLDQICLCSDLAGLLLRFYINALSFSSVSLWPFCTLRNRTEAGKGWTGVC